MGGLRKFEQRLEEAISGMFARAFRSAVQPVEIAAALQREADNNAQILSRDRRLVPNDFHVELSQADLERLAPYDSAMARELTSQLQEHAQRQSYVFPGPVTIGFEAADDLSTGRFRVTSRAMASVQGAHATGSGYASRARCWRSTAPGTRCSRPGWWSAAAPRPTSGSTTPASAASTSSSPSTVGTVEEGSPLRLAVRDLGSTNGMLVDGHRATKVGAPRRLARADRQHRHRWSDAVRGRPRRGGGV